METEVGRGRQLVEEPRLELDRALAVTRALGLAALVYRGSGVRSGEDRGLSAILKHYKSNLGLRERFIMFISAKVWTNPYISLYEGISNSTQDPGTLRPDSPET